MINIDYTVEEIETRFFNYLRKQAGDFEITERLNQIKGGNEAYLYKFQVKGLEGLEKPQVLRLFPSFYNKDKADWEALVQNLMYKQDVPVPKVFLSSSDTSILGGSFLVMDFVDGDAIDMGVDPSVLNLAARTQATLHQIDVKPIIDEIRSLGHTGGSHTVEGRLNWLLGRAKKYPELKPYFNWLIENMPQAPEKLSVVHGDFHPLNFLVKNGEVVAILDWSGFTIGDPMAGLGWTTALFIATSKHSAPPEVFGPLLQMYHDEYAVIQPIDHEKLDYFITFRLTMAYLEGKDGQEFWAQPEIVKTIESELKERTGISTS